MVSVLVPLAREIVFCQSTVRKRARRIFFSTRTRIIIGRLRLTSRLARLIFLRDFFYVKRTGMLGLVRRQKLAVRLVTNFTLRLFRLRCRATAMLYFRIRFSAILGKTNVPMMVSVLLPLAREIVFCQIAVRKRARRVFFSTRARIIIGRLRLTSRLARLIRYGCHLLIIRADMFGFVRGVGRQKFAVFLTTTFANGFFRLRSPSAVMPLRVAYRKEIFPLFAALARIIVLRFRRTGGVFLQIRPVHDFFRVRVRMRVGRRRSDIAAVARAFVTSCKHGQRHQRRRYVRP